ncbi:MAG TPA: sigma-70 family RNA polymerase sigma factor [bacterium]|nr:sigma-70 family RNA polymerase sigma factor [bacterium]
MTNSKQQFSSTDFFDVEFLQALKQALPLLKIFVEIAHTHSSDNSNTENSLPCKTCLKTGQCKVSCDLLERLLPGKSEGSAILNNTVGDLINDTGDSNTPDSYDSDESPNKPDRSFLKAIDRVRSDEIFGFYKNCSFIFTPKEWRIITLRVQQGKTYRTIGKELGIATSTASDTFQRAKKKMEEYYRKKY